MNFMTFSFAIFLLCPLAVFLDANALSGIVEEHLENYHVLITHLRKIMGVLNARNIYIYFHSNMIHSHFLQSIIETTYNFAPAIVTLTSSHINVKEGVKSLVVIVIPNTTVDLQSTLRHVELRKHSKYKYNFLIMITAPVERDINSWIRDLFQVFWQRKQLNAIVMYWNYGIKITSYTPFTQNFLLPLTCDNVTIDYLFPANKVINMNLMPLHVSLFADGMRAIISHEGKLSGADGYMTSLVVERMNATLVLNIISTTDSYGSLTNGTTNGSLWNVASGPSDVSFNNRFLIYRDFCDIAEATFIYGRDDLCILVPSTGLVPRFINIFRSLSGNVWMTVITVLFVIFASLKWTQWVEKRYGFPKKKDLTFITFIGIHLNQYIPKLSQSFRSRLIIAFWIFYCYIITNAFQAHLTTNLMLRLSYPQINDLDALQESKLTILTIPKCATQLNNNFDQTSHERLKKNLKVITYEEFYQLLDETNTNYAYAHKYGFLKQIVHQKQHTVHNRAPYHLMAQCPVPFFTVYIVKYGSPYLSSINIIMRRAQEMGLIDHWEDYMRARQKIMERRYHNYPNGPIPLSISHTQAAFYILAIGLVLGLAAFAHEVCHKKFPYGRNSI